MKLLLYSNTHCNTLQHISIKHASPMKVMSHCNTLQKKTTNIGWRNPLNKVFLWTQKRVSQELNNFLEKMIVIFIREKLPGNLAKKMNAVLHERDIPSVAVSAIHLFRVYKRHVNLFVGAVSLWSQDHSDTVPTNASEALDVSCGSFIHWVLKQCPILSTECQGGCPSSISKQIPFSLLRPPLSNSSVPVYTKDSLHENGQARDTRVHVAF